MELVTKNRYPLIAASNARLMQQILEIVEG
jgi:hypothetical protein